MLKKILISGLVVLSMSSAINASDYDLKTNMYKLNDGLTAVQLGMLTNNPKATLAAVKEFKKEIDELLGDKENIKNLLPEKLKYKASMATNAATSIDKYINEIESACSDKSLKKIERENRTQKAFLNIQHQCFRCHNMVRDWE